MRRLLLVLLVMSFLLFSCSEKESPESLYNQGKLKEAIALSDRILSESLDEDALYYKAVSYYSLDITGEAEEAATLYLLLYSDGKYRTEALSIIFMTGSDSNALDAGKGLKFPKWARLYVSYVLPLIVLFILVMSYIQKFGA